MFKKLKAPFPPEKVSWRVGPVTKKKDKAIGLAYIDSRDVQDKLDEVCGPENWKDHFEFNGKRTLCHLSIRCDGEWITKVDGAGDSDIESEKGALSDSFKRAAVKWGIGRYLYDIKANWLPIDEWKNFTPESQRKLVELLPGSSVESKSEPKPEPPEEYINLSMNMDAELKGKSKAEAVKWWEQTKQNCPDFESLSLDWQKHFHANVFTPFYNGIS